MSNAPDRGGPGTVTTHEATLRRLELIVRLKLDGLLHGDYLGLVPGSGSELAGGRVYSPGDDVRRMDWNLTARSQEPHIRDTIADRELETWIVVDASASLDFGTVGCEKRDLATAAAAAFGFLTAQAGNRLGALVFDSAGTSILPPRGGRAATLALLHRIEARPRAVTGEADLAAALTRVAGLARRRGLVVVVSDLLDTSDWRVPLRLLAARHDVVVAQVTDRREAALPAVGVVTFVDPESGRRVEAQTSDPRLRARFATAAAAQRETLAQAVRAAGAAHLVLATDRDWVLDIVKFAAARRRRR